MPRGHRKSLARQLQRLGVLSLVVVACSDLLGIESGTPREGCSSDADCSDGGCNEGRCATAVPSAGGGTGGDGPGPCASPACMSGGSGGTPPSEGGAPWAAGSGGESGATAGQGGEGGAPPGGSGAPPYDEGGDGGTPHLAGAGGQVVLPDGGVGGGGEDGEPGCTEGTSTCSSYQPLTCKSGAWAPLGNECAVICREGACFPPPSCLQTPLCVAQSNCCESIWVPGGGPFEMGAGNLEGEATYERSVTGFYLDRFEVTVGRFVKFAADYGPLRVPAAGSGANPRIVESGWDEAWNELPHPYLPEMWALPRTQAELIAQITQHSACTWGKASDLPITCITWYLAFAFCIWDGGRLPTEAEWNYAASAGRGYPYAWSRSPTDTMVSAEHASYLAEEPAAVGTFPRGRGFFERYAGLGHEDLAGNVSEWVADGVDPAMPQDARSDYMTPWMAASDERVLRGGGYDSPSRVLRSGSRAIQSGGEIVWSFGLRCARD